MLANTKREAGNSTGAVDLLKARASDYDDD